MATSQHGRGFASMDPERRREVASKGGMAAQARGTAHRFTSEQARVAGRKGGQTVSQNREHMCQIGHKGGTTRARNAAWQREAPAVEGDGDGAEGGPRAKRDGR